MKKLLIPFLTLGLSTAAFAQEAATETKSFWSDPFSHPALPLYAILALIGLVIILITVAATAMLRVLNTLSETMEREKAAKTGVVYKPRASFWDKFTTAANAAVPVEHEKSIELDHNFDGIRELDNHLPPWWKYLFYFTIVWGIIYVIVYHFTDSLPLPSDEYKNEVAEAEVTKRNFLATQPKVEIDENTLTYSADAEIIGKGKETYQINCSPCHKADGGGGVGPNLTDEYWLHGGDVKNVYATIKNGIPEKGMISWAGVLKPEEIRNVSFFVLSRKGTNPPGAKGPQGTLSAPQAPAATDSTKTRASL
jgi:cytochrome c oxidase cbb3-type subunit III